MDDLDEHARIIRIARAMCRSRRLDPDRPLDGALPAVTGARPFIDSLTSSDVPASAEAPVPVVTAYDCKVTV